MSNDEIEFRYNPSKFPYPLNEDMEKAYDAYRRQDKWAYFMLREDVFYSIKNAWRAGIVTFDEMKDMQGYFWGLLDEFE